MRHGSRDSLARSSLDLSVAWPTSTPYSGSAARSCTLIGRLRPYCERRAAAPPPGAPVARHLHMVMHDAHVQFAAATMPQPMS
jgi:hypothetical protein